MTEPNEEMLFKKPSFGGHDDNEMANKAQDESLEKTSSEQAMVTEEPKPQTVTKTILPEPMTTLSPPDGLYFVDQLKTGVLVQHMMLTKSRIIFGRATDCDVVLEHPSISRYHAVLLWSPANDEDFASGKLIFDIVLVLEFQPMSL